MVRTAPPAFVAFACPKSLPPLASQSIPAENQTRSSATSCFFPGDDSFSESNLTRLRCLQLQHEGIEFKLGGHWLLHTQHWTLMCLWGVWGGDCLDLSNLIPNRLVSTWWNESFPPWFAHLSHLLFDLFISRVRRVATCRAQFV